MPRRDGGSGSHEHRCVRDATLRRRAHRVTDLLAARYGSPRHDNKDDPLDELVFIVLSQMTTHWSFRRVYERLKAEVPTWRAALEMPEAAFKALVADAGLSGQKVPRLLSTFRRLEADFGDVTLVPLRRMRTARAERYLTSLPGVGLKTAKCVLMYSLGRRVLPIDTHVRRVATRLGFLAPATSHSEIHHAIEAAVPAADRYAFHVNAIAHGRTVCLARVPRCQQCCVRRLCQFEGVEWRDIRRPSPTRS